MKKKQVLLMMNARKFLSVIVQYAAQHNWRLTLMNDGIAPRGWKGDGAIVSFSRSESQMRFIAKFAQTSTPVVGLSYARPDIEIPRAVVDYSQNARIAAEHLHSKGYRHSSITVDEIAAKFSVSVSKLHRLFRDEMKTTPLAELRTLRFNKAKSLLRTTDFTLDYIAHATGFLHPPHLVNAFRSSVGLPPAEWRRLWK